MIVNVRRWSDVTSRPPPSTSTNSTSGRSTSGNTRRTRGHSHSAVPPNAMMNVRRYSARGTTQNIGTTATSLDIKVVTASIRPDGTNEGSPTEAVCPEEAGTWTGAAAESPGLLVGATPHCHGAGRRHATRTSSRSSTRLLCSSADRRLQQKGIREQREHATEIARGYRKHGSRAEGTGERREPALKERRGGRHYEERQPDWSSSGAARGRAGGRRLTVAHRQWQSDEWDEKKQVKVNLPSDAPAQRVWEVRVEVAEQQRRLKKRTQVFQTDGLPPSLGSASFANIGWTRNSRLAPVNIVTAKSATVPARTRLRAIVIRVTTVTGERDAMCSCI